MVHGGKPELPESSDDYTGRGDRHKDQAQLSVIVVAESLRELSLGNTSDRCGEPVDAGYGLERIIYPW